MKSLLIALPVLAMLCCVPASAATAPDATTHDLVMVSLQSPAAEAFLREHRNQLDIVRVKPGSHAELVATADDLDLLRQAGLDFEVKTKNLEQHYADRQDKSRGTFGLWHTYSESAAFQDSLRLLYPHVVSEKWSLGQTHEGNEIWAFRVSANPDVDEDEPEILIDGMHHAREIMSSEFCIMFAEHLARNYGTDPEITWLLDNRELYVVPMVNPDGVLYNELTDPAGGGMWRKNRRNNGDGSYGVDPNRNYPYQWGADDSGSSPYPSDITYRGPYAGSEPCIQALMAFHDSRDFITHDTIHTYSNLLLYPWGFTTSPTSHDAVFMHMAEQMTRYNGYTAGQPGEVLYNVNGGTFDWVYGDLSGHQLDYSFSTEIGGSSDGFWPPESRRYPLFLDNLWPHLYLMRVAGPYVECHTAVVQAGASKSIEPGQSGTLNFTVENQSVVASILDLGLTVSSDDPWVHFGSAQVALGDLASLASVDLGGQAIPITVDPACPAGHLASFTVTTHLAEGDLASTLQFLVGQPTGLLVNDFETGAGDWVMTGNWGLTSQESHSPDYCLTDTPGGNYTDETAFTATTARPYAATQLSFFHRYDMESNYDYARVQVSVDGAAWTTLESFTGNVSTWQEATYDLSEYAGQELFIRFLVDTDYSITRDGWYIDDVVITGAGSDNQAPPVPQFALAGLPDMASAVSVFNVTDPEGSPVVYGFRLYSDALCTQLVSSVDDLPAGVEFTEWQIPSVPDGDYWARAYASDGEQRSLLNQPISLNLNSASAVGDDMVVSGPGLRVLDHVSGGTARLQLGVPESGRVALDIYDMRGARVRTLYSGVMEPGVRVLTWDGRDDSGRLTASGMYFVRMVTGGQAVTGKVVVVR